METSTLAGERIERAGGSAPPPANSRSAVQRGTAFLRVLRGFPARFVPGPRQPRLPASHRPPRSEEHTSELQSLMRNSYAVFCLKKKKKKATQSSLLTSKRA